LAFYVLVTGSRTWTQPETIRRGLLNAQARHPGHRMVLRHGKCPPCHPARPRVPIRWEVAKRLAVRDQFGLLGADWLSDVVATELGWEIEHYPADWHAECQATCPSRSHRRTARTGESICPAAGNYRNTVMVTGMTGMLGECQAYVDACTKPGCQRVRAHGSHGAVDCLAKTRNAGIPVKLISNGWG
jgi:hypothetical protein